MDRPAKKKKKKRKKSKNNGAAGGVFIPEDQPSGTFLSPDGNYNKNQDMTGAAGVSGLRGSILS